MLKMTVISGRCSGGLVASFCWAVVSFWCPFKPFEWSVGFVWEDNKYLMSGNKNSALPFSSLSLAPLGSASGRSGNDSVLPLAGHSALLQRGELCAVPWTDSGWQSSKCSCGKEGSGSWCVWLDKASLSFCSFLVAWICTIHVSSPPSHTRSRSCLLY